MKRRLNRCNKRSCSDPLESHGSGWIPDSILCAAIHDFRIWFAASEFQQIIDGRRCYPHARIRAEPCLLSSCLRVTQRPNIGSDRRRLSVRQLRSSHRRHGAAKLFRVGHTFSDHFQDSSKAAITPHPFSFREIGTDGSPGAFRAVASGACGTPYLSVVNAASQRDHRWR